MKQLFKRKKKKKCGRGLMATRPRYPPLHNIAVKKQNKKALQYYIYTCIYRLPHESCFSVPASKLKLKFDNSRSHIYQLAK
jgi:hypothetical protein